MAHECNIYCSGTRHGVLLFASEPDGSRVWGEYSAHLFGAGAHFITGRPAPECPIPDYKGRPHGPMYAFLLIIDAPAFHPEKAQWP